MRPINLKLGLESIGNAHNHQLDENELHSRGLNYN